MVKVFDEEPVVTRTTYTPTLGYASDGISCLVERSRLRQPARYCLGNQFIYELSQCSPYRINGGCRWKAMNIHSLETYGPARLFQRAPTRRIVGEGGV